MEDSTVFSCVAYLLNDRSLKSLSLVSKVIRTLYSTEEKSQFFWFRRTEVLLELPLQFSGNEWKIAHRALFGPITKKKFTRRVLECPTAVRALLRHPRASKWLSGEEGEEVFIQACELNCSETVKLLLEDGRVDPVGEYDEGLISTCESYAPRA